MAGKYQRESHENLHGKDERKIDTKSNRACHETDVIRYHGKKAGAFLYNFHIFNVLRFNENLKISAHTFF